VAGVVFANVNKKYGDVEVIRSLDLEVRDEEFMVLVGPSGCGKSTALRMIAGLEEITSGTVSIGGRVVNDLPPKDRDIAMVFQSYALYPHMSVRQNMDFGLRIRKMDRAEIDRRVDDAARILGIADYLDRKPRQLSGGQRQRVAVGRAIVRQPAVFLFDEPLSNLDAKLRVQMRAEITGLQRRLRTTTVYVTHDQVEAMTMGHRIAVLHAGELQQVGTPLDLYDRPANVFVARFIGTPPMNFVRARTAGAGTRLSGAAGLDLELVPELRGLIGNQDGRELMVGIRPEHLRNHPRGEGAPTATLRVKVELVETLGHEVLVYGRHADDLLAAKVDPHEKPEIEQEIDLFADLETLHLFDAASELRLTHKESAR
jgi:multiple sugar transport system ATP-binding protein